MNEYTRGYTMGYMEALRNYRKELEHTDTLEEAYQEHKADVCPKCGATWPAVVGTLFGYIVECQHCGAMIKEVELC